MEKDIGYELKVNFSYSEGLTGFDIESTARISFVLNTKRGKKIYSQSFIGFCPAKPKFVFYKLKKLLAMLDKQIKLGYLSEITGDYYNQAVIKQRKLTKNTWVTDKRLN